MGEALLQMYETMSETEQKELYNFALFIVSKRKEKNPLEEFCGVISDEDAAIMMSASDECRKIELDEW